MKVILLHKFKHSYEKKTHNSKKKVQSKNMSQLNVLL